MAYADKLKDPRWQKKRLEVLQRDNFTCKKCGDNLKQLHVHHLSYTYGKEPWEYHLSEMQTLCMKCHREEEDMRTRFNDLVHDLLVMGVSYKDMYSRIAAISRLAPANL